eukprot:TRINITY_DN1896_c0_g1_i11.p2 TRINITY_DN1896_c0_g1~~TRINITY_DN1896_c0_g1_i11.p2  ORF type:complete len:108 (+),score=11.67 TRINITY_DN1896_c0_g1_i11:86-409(+)
MAVVSSCREMLVQVPQRAQPLHLVAIRQCWALQMDCPIFNGEEGGDDVKSVWPLHPGLHTYYNARHNGMPSREVEQIPQNRAQFRLQSATRLHEVGIASNGASATAP